MNEEACCKSMIKEKVYERVFCKRSTKALSLSDVFLNIIVKKMRIDLNWMKNEAQWFYERRRMFVQQRKCLWKQLILKQFTKILYCNSLDWFWFSSNSRRFFIIDSINQFWMNAYWMSDKSSSNSMIICSHWFYESSHVVLVFQDWIIR